MNINGSFHPYYFPAQKIRKVSHYSTLDKAVGGVETRHSLGLSECSVSCQPVRLTKAE